MDIRAWYLRGVAGWFARTLFRLQTIVFQFVPIIPRLHFGFLTVITADFRASAYREYNKVPALFCGLAL